MDYEDAELDLEYDHDGTAAEHLARAVAGSTESGEPTPDQDSSWTDLHGISLDVRNARPYHRYETGGADDILDRTFATCALNQIKWAKNRTKHSAGWVMEAHPYPGFRPAVHYCPDPARHAGKQAETLIPCDILLSGRTPRKPAGR